MDSRDIYDALGRGDIVLPLSVYTRISRLGDPNKITRFEGEVGRLLVDCIGAEGVFYRNNSSEVLMPEC